MGKKLAIGAVVGAVAGMVAGVLMAPKSGKETRGNIKRRAEILKDNATTVAKEKKAAIEKKAAGRKDKAGKATK